jgi:uncharacterized Tic20 family protein
MTQPVRSEDTLLALASHLSWIVGLPILVPLVIYLVRGNVPFVREHAAEAVNFHITTAIYAAVGVVLLVVVVGLFVLAAVGLFFLVCSVLAAVAAGNGRRFRYPATLHLLR